MSRPNSFRGGDGMNSVYGEPLLAGQAIHKGRID
jgi:hypothetical protein